MTIEEKINPDSFSVETLSKSNNYFIWGGSIEELSRIGAMINFLVDKIRFPMVEGETKLFDENRLKELLLKCKQEDLERSLSSLASGLRLRPGSAFGVAVRKDYSFPFLSKLEERRPVLMVQNINLRGVEVFNEGLRLIIKAVLEDNLPNKVFSVKGS